MASQLDKDSCFIWFPLQELVVKLVHGRCLRSASWYRTRPSVLVSYRWLLADFLPYPTSTTRITNIIISTTVTMILHVHVATLSSRAWHLACRPNNTLRLLADISTYTFYTTRITNDICIHYTRTRNLFPLFHILYFVWFCAIVRSQ